MMIVPDTGSETAARRAQPASASLLEAAIERGGLHPFFHAKVAMSTRKIVGFGGEEPRPETHGGRGLAERAGVVEGGAADLRA